MRKRSAAVLLLFLCANAHAESSLQQKLAEAALACMWDGLQPVQSG